MATDPERSRFDGLDALVVGGAGSIGIELAQLLTARGARVTCADVVPAEVGQRLVGSAIAYFECDATNEASVAGLFTELRLGQRLPSCAANVLGIVGADEEITSYDHATWNRVIAINLTSVMLLLKEQIPAMIGRGGSIVNFASVAGYNGERRRAAYVAAKAGVIGLTKTAALENAPNNVRVNAVVPGPVGNDLFYANAGGKGSSRHREVESTIPMGRLAETSEIAMAAAWLLSREASFVTGHALVVDGGFSAQ